MVSTFSTCLKKKISDRSLKYIKAQKSIHLLRGEKFFLISEFKIRFYIIINHRGKGQGIRFSAT